MESVLREPSSRTGGLKRQAANRVWQAMHVDTGDSRRRRWAITRSRSRAHAALALSLVAALSAGAECQDGGSPDASAAQATDTAPMRAAGTGRQVSGLDAAIMFVFQARNGDYWFGSDERGAYRHDGKSLVNFTTEDGLAGNQVKGFQEDEAGSVYVTTYAGISRFDGQAFSRLNVSPTSAVTDWKLESDDLWFVAGQDSGAVYRFDGEVLHRLTFPPTRDGDAFLAQWPRDQYPNARFSPYDVFTIFKDSQGSVWFGTACLGACRYDGTSFAWLPESELRNGSFGTRAIVEDREGKFWFCDPLHRYAVERADAAAPVFRREDGLRDARDPGQPPFEGILSSTLDRAGALWMATYGQGVWRHDGKDLVHYPVLDGGQGVTLFSIHEDNQGVMWLGTHTAGPYRFNGTSFEKFNP